MVLRVVDVALRSGAENIWVATDDVKIASVVEEAGFSAVMTNDQHISGTDRLAEACEILNLPEDNIVVNIQGDEPQMASSIVRDVAIQLSNNKDFHVSTACMRLTDPEKLTDSNVVKVILDNKNTALYFSRASIPWERDKVSSNIEKNPLKTNFYHHLGIYGYRAGFLKTYSKLEIPMIEKQEKLEQLRVIWNGFDITCVVCKTTVGWGIDTPEDLKKLNEYLSNNLIQR